MYLIDITIYFCVIMFVKITFRFKECMQRLSFRANQFGDI